MENVARDIPTQVNCPLGSVSCRLLILIDLRADFLMCGGVTGTPYPSNDYKLKELCKVIIKSTLRFKWNKNAHKIDPNMTV